MLLFQLNVLFCLLINLFVNARTSKLPICVIGAGPSGLYSALKLQQKGYQTVVFEKTSQVGGKVETVNFPEINGIAELTAIIIDETSQPLMNLIKTYNATLLDIQSNTNKFRLDVYNKDSLNLYTPTIAVNLMALIYYKDIQKYYLIRKKFPEVNDFNLVGYDNVHDELTLPFEQFLQLYDLKSILPFFNFLSQAEGYGSMSETPALYVLRLYNEFHLKQLGLQTKTIHILKEGYQNFLIRVAKDIRDIRLDSNITKIDRINQDHQVVNYIRNGTRSKQDCNRIIIAFPPLLERVQRVFDLNYNETNLFSKVVHSRYFAAIITTESSHEHYDMYLKILRNNNRLLYGIISSILNFDFLSALIDEPDGDGEVIGISQIPTPGVFTTYSWIRKSISNITSCEDIKLVKSKLLPTFKNAVQNIKSPKVIRFKSFDYFPHILTEDLKNNWYKKLRNIQGYLGTYYTGSILDMENVGATMRAADHIIKKYF